MKCDVVIGSVGEVRKRCEGFSDCVGLLKVKVFGDSWCFHPFGGKC